MGRSCVNLVGNTTSVQNVGTGIDIFKGKTGGNTLQIKSLSVCGTGMSITCDDNNIYFSAATTGGGSVSAGLGISVSGTTVSMKTNAIEDFGDRYLYYDFHDVPWDCYSGLKIGAGFDTIFDRCTPIQTSILRIGDNGISLTADNAFFSVNSGITKLTGNTFYMCGMSLGQQIGSLYINSNNEVFSGVTVGGTNGQLQFNDNGINGGSNLTYDDVLNTFSLYGTPIAGTGINYCLPSGYDYGSLFNYMLLRSQDGCEIGTIQQSVNGSSVACFSCVYAGTDWYGTTSLCVGSGGTTGAPITCIQGSCVNFGQEEIRKDGPNGGYDIISLGRSATGVGQCELLNSNGIATCLSNRSKTLMYFKVIATAVNGSYFGAVCKIEGAIKSNGTIIGTPSYTTMGDEVAGCYTFTVSGATNQIHVYGCNQCTGVVCYGATIELAGGHYN